MLNEHINEKFRLGINQFRFLFCLRATAPIPPLSKDDFRELFTFLPQNNIALQLGKNVLFYLSTFFIPLSVVCNTPLMATSPIVQAFPCLQKHNIIQLFDLMYCININATQIPRQAPRVHGSDILCMLLFILGRSWGN